MADQFRVVFDLSMQPDSWLQEVGWFFVLPLIGLLSVFIPESLRNSRLYRGPKGVAAKIFGLVLFLFGSALCIFPTIDHIKQKNKYIALLQQERLSFVGGCLQSFHSMPASGHEDERIDVAGQKFSYSDFDKSSPAFNNTEAYGGPIHSDSSVKIWHEGNNIIRLAVRDHACRSAPDRS